jgi:hypothetical protein
MKSMASVSGDEMSIFKASLFQILINHCGRVIKFQINVRRRATLIDQKFVVTLGLGQRILAAQVVDK